MRRSGRRDDASSARRLLPFRVPMCALMAVACMALAGCGGGSGKGSVQVGPIAFVDANGNQLGGQHTSMSVGATTYVDAALSGNTAYLGVDWTVNCGSAPPPGTPLPPGDTQDESCGVFTPVHTTSAPVPQYAGSGAGIVTVYTAPAAPPKTGVVTLYAAATGDHSQYATVTLTILAQPISISFAPPPPSTLPVSGMTSLKAVLTNDYTAGGAKWTAACGSADCGSFSAAQTASGVATTYTAPATAPAAGTVQVTATSVTDPTKTVSASIAILPIAVTVAQSAESVVVDGTALFSATVANDVSNAGVDWTLACGTGSACGAITGHTAAGMAATFTAPAAVPGSGAVQVTATSTADTAASATATVTISATTPVVRGRVRAGYLPVAGSSVYLYAAGESGYGAASTLLNGSERAASLTNNDGTFAVVADRACPSGASQLYLVAVGGDTGAGVNPNRVMATALGVCSGAGLHNVTINEVTTVAAAWALAGFMRDAAHAGTAADNLVGLENAFATAENLVDAASGEARVTTPAVNGVAPRAEINTLADMLNRCSATGGGSAGDGSPCGNLFANAGGPATENTLQAALTLAHASAEADPAGMGLLYAAARSGPFAPTLDAAPENWSLALRFTGKALQNARSIAIDASGHLWIAGDPGVTELNCLGAPVPESSAANLDNASLAAAESHRAAVDPSGNRWMLDDAGDGVTEMIGAARPATAPQRAAGTISQPASEP